MCPLPVTATEESSSQVVSHVLSLLHIGTFLDGRAEISQYNRALEKSRGYGITEVELSDLARICQITLDYPDLNEFTERCYERFFFPDQCVGLFGAKRSFAMAIRTERWDLAEELFKKCRDIDLRTFITLVLYAPLPIIQKFWGLIKFRDSNQNIYIKYGILYTTRTGSVEKLRWFLELNPSVTIANWKESLFLTEAEGHEGTAAVLREFGGI